MKHLLWNLSANLRNSQIAKKKFIFQPKTKLTTSLLNILWDEGFIFGYKICNSDLNLLKIFLKYKNGSPVINSLKIISKPSRQVYYSASDLWKLDVKKTLIILTTPKGLLTINECKQTKTGGKLLLIIQ